MKASFLTAVFVWVCLSLIASESYACKTPPIPEIVSPYIQNVCVGCDVEFDGVGSCVYETGSHDPDNKSPEGCGHGIDVYYWNYSEDSNWYEDGGEPNHTWDEAGSYWVYLYVRDDEDVLSSYYVCCLVYVVEVNNVEAGGKDANETLYLANDYLDEPNERAELSQSVQATLNPDVSTPDCFYWTPRGDSSTLPRIEPNESTGAYFYAKDHGVTTITAHCGTSVMDMNVAIEGIDIKTANITDPCELTETYNIFLNENFDQELDAPNLPGHTQCYYVDHNDHSLAGDKSDEIGTITLVRETCGDTSAEVRFDSSSAIIKLYRSSTEKLEFGTYYLASSLPGSLKVEGTATGTTTLTATIKTQDNYTATDQLKIKVIPLNATAVSPAPSSDQHEICHKDKLIIAVNNNDSDNDGTIDSNDPNVSGGDPDIAKITLQKPTGAVDSDISGVITVTYPGNIDAWKSQDKAGGAAATTFALSDLPNDIYLEGKTVSGAILDSKIEVEMTLDSGVVCRDEIRYTVMEITLTKCSSSWLPKGGSEDNPVPCDGAVDTMTVTILPSGLCGIIKCTLYDVSDEPGYCINRPSTVPGSGEDSDSWKDLQFKDPQMGFDITGSNKDVATTVVPVNIAYVTANCYDYGAYGKMKAEVQIETGGKWFKAHVENGYKEFARIPRDDDNEDNEKYISVAWDYHGAYDSDDDISLNNDSNGDGLTRYEEYRGVDIDDDDIIPSSERLNPDKKNLFVQGSGFGGSFPSFAYGNAFNEAQINVHDFVGTVGTDDRNIDVLVVTLENLGDHIYRYGDPVNAIRYWNFYTLGWSAYGGEVTYGSPCRVHKKAMNYYFSDKPHVDGSTWTAPGQWNDPPNGVLDPVDKVEDGNDNGVLDNNEKDGNASPPHDDGDDDFDGDYPVKSGATWEYNHNLSPFDIDNDGKVEHPRRWGPEYTKAQVVRHNITHEMGHAVGIYGPRPGGHCDDETCLMFEWSNTWTRDGHFCNACRAKIRIHNN